MDRKWLETSYKTYAPMVYRRCLRLLGAAEDARELTQEVFLHAASLPAGTTLDNAGAWYNRVATNLCLNRLRDQERRPQWAQGDELLQAATVDDPERGLWAVFLSKVFARMDEEKRNIAVLHLLDGLTLEETAAQLGLSVAAVRRRLEGLTADARKAGRAGR